MKSNEVSIRKTTKDLKEDIANVIKDIGGLGPFFQQDDRIIIKPNVNGTECVTRSCFVDALVRLLKDFSARNILIAESTFGNIQNTHNLLSQNGYFEIAKKHGVKVISIFAKLKKLRKSS